MADGTRSRTRTLIAPAVLAATIAGGVAVADAAVRSGSYRGNVDTGQFVGLKVSDDGTRVSQFRFRRLRMRCSDGDSFRLTGRFTSGRKKLPVSRSGRFRVRVTYSDGGSWIARGRIRGRRATGTLQVRVRFNGNDRPTPNGSVRCTSGKRSFSARTRAAGRRRGGPSFTG